MSPPSPVSASASRKPDAKHIAPPAPARLKLRITSIVASRLMPRKLASGGEGSASTDLNAIRPSNSSRDGCTGQISPSNPTLRHSRITFVHHVPPPITAMVRGLKRRWRSLMRIRPALRPCTNHAPSGRKSSRLMICRWISEVPSQMRSTRASRQKRSIGKSSMRPMPPKTCKVASVTRASISDA